MYFYRGQWRAHSLGVAAGKAECKKYRDYAPNAGGRPVNLVPLIFETYGRWGKAAIREMKRLASMRALRGDSGGIDVSTVRCGVLTRWRQQVAVALQRGNFGMYSAAVRAIESPARVHAAPVEYGELGAPCRIAALADFS